MIQSLNHPPALRGVFAPILTPLDPELNPDVPRMAEHARWLLDHGCHGLVVFGTTGEATSFASDERMATLEGLLAAGLPPEKLLVGTGACSVPETATLTRHAVAQGCAGVLMLPPFYYKDVPDQGLFHHFAQVIDRVADDRLRIYLYHIPQFSGVPFSLELIQRLVDAFPATVVGIKDSSGQWENLRAILERFPGFGTFSGTEAFLLRTLRAGGVGTISAMANVIPERLRHLYDHWQEPEADAWQAQLMETRQRIARYGTIPGLKLMVAEQRQDPCWRRVRPPLVALEGWAEEGGRQTTDRSGEP